MKKKHIVIIIPVAILIALLIAILYPCLVKNATKKSTYDFLFQDGYTELDIACIEVRHSYISGLLGYGQWHTSLYFKDEPKVEYYCILSNDLLPMVTAISAGGFSSELPEEYAPLHYEEDSFH